MPGETVLKRPDHFMMAFRLNEDGDGLAVLNVTFGREHIPFLIKALNIAEDILAIDAPATDTEGKR